MKPQPHLSAYAHIRCYIRTHQITATNTLKDLLHAPFSTIMLWLVIAIALVLPTIFYLTALNTAHLTQRLDGKPSLSIILKAKVTPQTVKRLVSQLEQWPYLSKIRYIDPDVALQTLRKQPNMPAIIDSLDSNPLPPMIRCVITLLDRKSLDTLMQNLKKWPEIEKLHLDLNWVEKLRQITQIAQRMVWFLGLLMGAGILLVIGNVIRMTIDNRHDEILVMKLVGGSHAYIRRPFLYLGVWFGLGGSLIALLITYTLIWLLNGPVTQLSLLYHHSMSLQGPHAGDALVLCILSIMLGWIGAQLFCRYYIRQIEPI